ncbi:Uncharacterized protein PBTT_08149 [Plasmodiophora brassicae]
MGEGSAERLAATLSLCSRARSGGAADRAALSKDVADLLRDHPSLPDSDVNKLLVAVPFSTPEASLALMKAAANAYDGRSHAILVRLRDWSCRTRLRSEIEAFSSDERPAAIAATLVCAAGQSARERSRWALVGNLVTRLLASSAPAFIHPAVSVALLDCPWIVSSVPAVLPLCPLNGLLSAISFPLCTHQYPGYCPSCSTSFLPVVHGRAHDAFCKIAPLLAGSFVRLMRSASDQARESAMVALHEFVTDTYNQIDIVASSAPAIRTALNDQSSPLRSVTARLFLSVTTALGSCLSASAISVALAADVLAGIEFARVRFPSYARLFLAVVASGLHPRSSAVDAFVDSYTPKAVNLPISDIARTRYFFYLSILQVWVRACSCDLFHSNVLPFVRSFLFSDVDAQCRAKAHRVFCARFIHEPGNLRHLAPWYLSAVADNYPGRVPSLTLQAAFSSVMSSLPETDSLLLYLFNVILLRARRLIDEGDRKVYTPAIVCCCHCLQNLHIHFIDSGLRMLDEVLEGIGGPARLTFMAALQASVSGNSSDVSIKDILVQWYLRSLVSLAIDPKDILRTAKHMSQGKTRALLM